MPVTTVITTTAAEAHQFNQTTVYGIKIRTCTPLIYYEYVVIAWPTSNSVSPSNHSMQAGLPHSRFVHHARTGRLHAFRTMQERREQNFATLIITRYFFVLLSHTHSLYDVCVCLDRRGSHVLNQPNT